MTEDAEPPWSGADTTSVSPRRAERGRRAGLSAGLVAGVLAGLLAGTVPSGAAPADASRPDYADAGRTVFLPFLDGTAPGPLPHLGLSFGGEARPAVVDTGSTGIVVSASRIPDIDALPARPGRLTYSSSGRIMIGRRVVIPVILQGGDGVSVTTRPVPVLAVDRIACTEQARDCRPEDAPRGVAMMGIGFGREGDGQAESLPDTNPLLNALPPGSGPVHRGYVVTREGVQVGLTRAGTGGDFRFVKLDPSPRAAGDWLGVPACIVLDGRTPGACGRGLIDTGVTAMFLTLPPDQVAGSLRADAEGRAALLPGTRLTIRFGNAAQYETVVDDHARPMAPTRIVLNTTRPEPFVNTGLHFFSGFDVLYDADGGYYAFRPRGRPPAESP